MALTVGTITSGKVESVMPFGAFVALPENKSGLVHISEITNEYIENINDYIKAGDTVSVKVLDIDKAGKISLSIKKAKPKRSAQKPSDGHIRPAEIDWSGSADKELSFEDKLSKCSSNKT